MNLTNSNNITIIGLGLLGGSMALALRKITNATIYGIDSNKKHLDKALELGIIDAETNLSELHNTDIVVLAVPVNILPALSIEILDKITNNTLVFDVGSTKHKICKTIENHPKRGNFVAAHPIAGTEFSGPEAAFDSLFISAKNIICDPEKTNKNILKFAIKLFDNIGMQTDFMESASHDKHIAYVSHLSHISSFMLGKTVMDLEHDEKNIFNMAGSGFASTVRLAKSSPKTWTPIFSENKTSILVALEEYIRNLQDFKTFLKEDDKESLYNSMQKINHIRTILNEE